MTITCWSHAHMVIDVLPTNIKTWSVILDASIYISLCFYSSATYRSVLCQLKSHVLILQTGVESTIG